MVQGTEIRESSPVHVAEEYIEVPAGKLASVVTYLEMRTPPTTICVTNELDLQLRAVRQADPGWYRQLFFLIGADWLWSTRSRLSDQQVVSILQDPTINLFVLDQKGIDCGLVELDRSRPPDIQISFLGLSREMLGKGAGRFLLLETLRIAWSYCPDRVTLHTCTLDHPKALSFYMNAGFIPYKRAVRITSDPRIAGTLPQTAAPQIPII